jgi:CRP-like cAMP-binding protein
MDVLVGVLRMQKLPANDYLFKQGMPGTACYIVAQGAIRVTLGALPKEQELAVLRRGALFGQVALIDGGRRSANCIADEDAVVLALDRNEFDLLFRSGSTFAFKFLDVLIRILVGQLRNANGRLAEVASKQQAQSAPARATDPEIQSFFKDLTVRTSSFRTGDFDIEEVSVVYSDADRARQSASDDPFSS